MISITVNEKILLFLLGYNKYRDSLEVPFAVSQKGIAEGIDIRVTHIPRAVQKLVGDNFITEFKTHFRGHLRKRKAYFLTEKGTAKALALKDDVGAQIVTIKRTDGRLIEKTLSDMYEDFGTSIYFFDFYLLFTRNNIVDESVLEKYRSAGGEAELSAADEYKDFKHNIPEHSHILGRGEEIDLISNWILSSEHNILIITGIKGIGKSALAANVLRTHQSDIHILWVDFQAGNKWDTIIHSLAELAVLNNYFKLDKYVKQVKPTGTIIPAKAIEILAEELKDLKLLVVLDNIHNIDGEFQELGTWLLPMMNFLPDWKILITSREQLPVELRSASNFEGKYDEIKLTGLDNLTSRKLLKTDLSNSEFESIYKYTDGNPLLLKAIRDLEADGKLDLKNFRPEELSLLKILKVHEELD